MVNVTPKVSFLWKTMDENDRAYYLEFIEDYRSEYQQLLLEYRATGEYDPSKSQFERLPGKGPWVRRNILRKNTLELELMHCKQREGGGADDAAPDVDGILESALAASGQGSTTPTDADVVAYQRSDDVLVNDTVALAGGELKANDALDKVYEAQIKDAVPAREPETQSGDEGEEIETVVEV